jgi:DNA (cytosine-5)-methyltransferase 1
MKTLTMGSLFDGIGGFVLAAQRSGIKTLWASEIDPTCIEITKRHFPRMEHLGDITKLNGADIPPVDIITFGSPCQDLSSAGAQRGIDGERSGLFRDAIRIIYEMRLATNGRYPTFIVWENVNGAFGSNGGNDFRTVLEEITNANIPMPDSGRWACAGMVRGCRGGASVAWRQLDSQYWGVPQRRKRIFLVGDFRAERAPQILFECEGLLGYVEKSGKKGKEIAASIVRDIETSGGLDSGQRVVDFGRTADRVYINADTARAITATDGGGGSATGLYLLREGEPITHPINLQAATRHNALGEGTGLGVAEEGQPTYTLQAAHSHAIFAAYPLKGTTVYDESNISSPVNASNPKMNAPCHTLAATNAGRAVLIGLEQEETPIAVYPINDGSIHGNANGLGFGVEGQEAPTLTASDRHAIAACYALGGHGGYIEGVGTLRARMGKSGRSSSNIVLQMYGNNSRGGFAEGCGTLRASGGDNGGGSENLFVIFKKFAFYVKYVLRRLTPLECERLQGFPDYWTKYNAQGGEIADTPRYTALGNSLAVPCAERVFRGIVAVVAGVVT